MATRCDPYKDAILKSLELIEQTSKVYIAAFEAITATKFVPDDRGHAADRVRASLNSYFPESDVGLAEILRTWIA